MKTLHLNLHRKWFDMTISGEKKEDYRDITAHWCVRLFDFSKMICDPTEYTKEILKGNFDDLDFVFTKTFKTTTLSNGYAKDRDQFQIEHKGIEIREGKEEWGAEKGKKYFVIKHGEIIRK